MNTTPQKFYPNSATLFTEKNKKNPRGPDITGTLMLGQDLAEYIADQLDAGNQEITLDLSGWKKVSRAGNKFLSVSVKKPFKAQPSPNSKSASKPTKSGFDEDEPF
jgi:hypothetical protein